VHCVRVEEGAMNANLLRPGPAGYVFHARADHHRHHGRRDPGRESEAQGRVHSEHGSHGYQTRAANGTFAARFANELAANTDIVVQKGSWGMWF
jgi:hypothetical protein